MEYETEDTDDGNFRQEFSSGIKLERKKIEDKS